MARVDDVLPGMMMAKTDFTSVDEYIASQPEAVQSVLERLRRTIRKAVPGADEVKSRHKAQTQDTRLDREPWIVSLGS